MPLTKDEIRSLLSDIENERVERTLSTDNTKKISEAICSFANDIRNTNKPGYFLIGADDNGNLDTNDIIYSETIVTNSVTNSVTNVSADGTDNDEVGTDNGTNVSAVGTDNGTNGTITERYGAISGTMRNDTKISIA